MRQFFRELKRRNVYKVAVAYGAVAFVGLQAARLLVPATRLPAWADQLFIFLAVAGFPVALVVAWAFELTPEGVRRTPESEPGREEAAGEGARTGSVVFVSLGLLVAGVAGVWYLLGAGGKTPSGRAPAPDTTRAGSPIRDRSIAVLPFENLGGEESEQFTQGVHDGLLTRLSNISDLTVISRTSVLQYRETSRTVPEIARDLGVAWVVEGAVQQAGGQVQVNAQLIHARQDAHRWAETYRRELNPENLFAVQSELTKKIAASLEARLSPEEQERVERRPTEDMEAYRLYMRGRNLSDQRTEAELRSALEYFRRAIRQDSSYALAWSGMADAYAFIWYYNYAPPERVSSPALRSARRAVELEPRLGEAHASLGIVRSLRQEGPSALQALTTAVELTPSHPEAHIWLSWIRLVLGRPGQAVRPAKRAVDLDPTSPPNRVYLAEALLANGEPEEALQQARRARMLRPEYGMAHFMVGLAQHHLGRHAEAEQAWKEARSLVPPQGSPTDAEVRAAIAAARAAAGDTATARAQLARIDSEESPFAAGLAAAAVGDVDAAIRAFCRVRDWDSIWTEHVRYFFPDALDPVRADSRYRDLIREVNAAWGLEPDGSLPDGPESSPGGPDDD